MTARGEDGFAPVLAARVPPAWTRPAAGRWLVGSTVATVAATLGTAPVAEGIEPAIYGTRWRGLVPDRLIRGENIPNVQLAHEYRAAGVVLNDHWDTMRDYGFISNRVFDVLACGGRLVSDEVPGLEELFGGMVRVYRDPAGLSEAVQSLLEEGRANQAERDAFARRVGHEHGFPARAAEIERVIRHLLDRAMAGPADMAAAGD